MPIQILSDVVAAQIAAGEVVERPASVVKELIENSLDAGARAVRVEVEQGGRRLMRVIDDGSGIPAHEAALAFARHATSKLSSIDDLQRLQTLGFRGEALASIASVAQVTMLTRTRAEDVGTLVRIEGGALIESRSAGSPVGTTVTVENLFFNTPARLKFMKADATERRHIDSVVTRYAIAYPNVRFTLVQDGRVTFATTGSGSLADVLVEALGLDIMREMLEVTPLPPARPDLPPISVYGYTSTPQLSRNSRSHIMLFVNGRHIQDSSLSYAVGQAYHTLLPADRFPVAVLLLTLPPADVDVNVHPTKAEVRFRSPDAVFSAVQRAVRRAVIAQTPIPTSSLFPGAPNPPGATAYEPRPWRDLSADNLPVGSRPAPDLVPPPGRPAAPSSDQADQLGMDLPLADAGRYTQQIPPETPPESSPAQPSEPESRPRSLPPLRVVGQLAGMYILAEGPAGLYLVDQHAAHERILYEQFMRERERQRPVAQRALEPVTMQLTPEALRLVEDNAEALRAVGFEIEPFGGRTIRVAAVPALLADRDVAEAVRAVLDDLESGHEPTGPTAEARLVLRVCKAAAVKAGQILSYSEMNALLRHLERCESPRTCPHGRPTMIHISAAQLAKEFGRA